MMLAHIMGIPVEETVLQLVPAGAATVTAVWIAVRARLRRPRRPGPGGDQRERAPAWAAGHAYGKHD
jgi:hypothetical protein